MFYVYNILNQLKKHYAAVKNPKKKISSEEEEFCKKLVRQIDKFCEKPSDVDQRLNEKFKNSKLNITQYVSKYRIKDVKNFERLVKRKRLAEKKQSASSASVFDRVRSETYATFVDRRKVKGEAVHYRDLQRWSMLNSRKLGLKSKCSSMDFANSIKKKYGLAGRRIQRRRNFNQPSAVELGSKANAFVDEVNSLIPDYAPSHVFNSDQIGINYEPGAKRTLDIRGTKLVTGNVTKVFNTTHSYTLQVYISLEGRIGSKLFMVLQETTGNKFGVRVQPLVDDVSAECKNVIVRCSKSGKMNKELLAEWVQHLKSDTVGSKLLLWDSWSAQRPDRYE